MDKVQEAIKVRYAHLHPLIFQRSLERATSNGELFDILESYSGEYPIVWDESLRRWVRTDDILQSKNIQPRRGQYDK